MNSKSTAENSDIANRNIKGAAGGIAAETTVKEELNSLVET